MGKHFSSPLGIQINMERVLRHSEKKEEEISMESIIGFLKSPSERRTKEEINLIAPFFQNNKFFANLLLESGEGSLNKALK